MTPTQKAAMQQALDALTKSVLFCNRMGVGDWQQTAMACHSGIAVLRAALAEPVVEPVAWALSHSRGIEFSSKYPMQKSRDAAEQMARQHMGATTVTPLYTSPPPPAEVPLLTDAEIAAALPWVGFDDLIASYSVQQLNTALRAIEQVVHQKAGLK